MSKKKENFAKLVSDYLPLIVFFIAFKIPKNSSLNPSLEPLVFATICLVVVTIFSLIFCYILTKKISKISLFSAIVISFFGLLTFYLNDEFFIKIKPTIINLIFAMILLIGYFIKKPMLAVIFENKITMSNQAWLTLSKRWGYFFILLAIINEIIWRNFSTEFWVDFKVFGMMTLTIIFSLTQMPFIIKNIKDEDSNR